jgi:hypothetical protein
MPGLPHHILGRRRGKEEINVLPVTSTTKLLHFVSRIYGFTCVGRVFFYKKKFTMDKLD